jgi:hypothetical protein
MEAAEIGHEAVDSCWRGFDAEIRAEPAGRPF